MEVVYTVKNVLPYMGRCWLSEHLVPEGLRDTCTSIIIISTVRVEDCYHSEVCACLDKKTQPYVHIYRCNHRTGYQYKKAKLSLLMKLLIPFSFSPVT